MIEQQIYYEELAKELAIKHLADIAREGKAKPCSHSCICNKYNQCLHLKEGEPCSL